MPNFPPVYTFGSFRFDARRGLLYHGSEVVAIPDRVAQLLILLLHANGGVLDKETIAARIWGDTAVSDNNLSQHIFMLRQLLEERAKDRSYVMTVRGKGYRFAAPVSVLAPVAEEGSVDSRDDAGDVLLRSGLDAFHQYSRGCYLLEKRTAGALSAASELFEAALQLDPEHVPALVGLARAQSLLAEYWYAPGSYTFPKAKGAAMRALEIDPSCAEAHGLLGIIRLFCDWNWVEAEREIETSIRLNPSSTLVGINAAWFYLCKGTSDKPLRQTLRALLAEPASPALQLFLARVFLHSGEYWRAVLSLSKLIENGPEFSIARRHRAQAYILNGQPAEALGDLMLLSQDRAEDLSLRLPLLGRAYADCGDIDRAEDIYRTLLEMAHTEFVVGFNLATVAVALGRLEEALQHLEQALEKHEPALLMLPVFPWFGPIAQRARFKAVLQAISPPSP